MRCHSIYIESNNDDSLSSTNKLVPLKRMKTGVETKERFVAYLIRAPFMPLLRLSDDEKAQIPIFQPFKIPWDGAFCERGDEFRNKKKTLGVRMRRLSCIEEQQHKESKDEQITDSVILNTNFEPLILWKSKLKDDGTVARSIEVDPLLTKHLRPHQREGVQFLFDTLMGLKSINFISNNREKISYITSGCILADDMGLGKTLQSITLLWTLLKQGFDTKPILRKAVIVCPASLVKNWSFEIEKWLQGRCKSIAVTEFCRDKVCSLFEGFKYDRQSNILITSYETLRLHVKRLIGCPIDLVICDEAHRLKNDRAKTVAAICLLPTKRRLLLSGTPIQNDLNEFYALASLCIPEVLGNINHFRKQFIIPILTGREPNATTLQKRKAEEKLQKLSEITNSFILRRTNVLLAQLLPPKTVIAIFCKLTPKQGNLYRSILACSYGHNEEGLKGNVAKKRALSTIQRLMKLCNHPTLIEKTEKNKLVVTTQQSNTELSWKNKAKLTEPVNNITTTSESGKMAFLHSLIITMRNCSTTAKDKIVIVSNFTQTLDLIQNMLKHLRLTAVRLDGTTAMKKRHVIISEFNSPHSSTFAFLLSSKAGGCGINLIGANRLVLFDPDWNPANDKQALARIWRDGQRKECVVYRLFSTGTIEEKIFQRQMCKDALSSTIISPDTNNDHSSLNDCLAVEDIQEIFQLNDITQCETYDLLKCSTNYTPTTTIRPGSEQDLTTWQYHSDPTTVPDIIASSAISNLNNHLLNTNLVSFAMSIRIEFVESQNGEVNKNSHLNTTNDNRSFSPISDDNDVLSTTTQDCDDMNDDDDNNSI